MAVAVAKMKADYDTAMKKCKHYQEVDKLLVQQYIDVVEIEFISTLKKSKLGWYKVTTKEMIKHIKSKYGRITAQDLLENEDRIRTPWHPSTATMESFWKQHDDGLECTKDCPKGKIDEDRLIMCATANLRNTDILGFKEQLTRFEAKPDNEQTWATFKDMMNETYNQLSDKEKAPPTTVELGYGKANNMKENGLTDPFPHYCWSHGVTWNEKHTSKTCHLHRRHPLHVAEATLFNMCGGCNKIQCPHGEKAVWKPPQKPSSESSNGSDE